MISKGKIHVRDASPGLYTTNSNGKGVARAQCSQASDDGSETLDTALPCPIGYDNAANSIVLYGTGWRFGADIKVRFRFQLGNGEEDEIEITSRYAGAYVEDDGVTHLGLDQIVVALDEDLANRVNVDTKVVLVSNAEALTSQDEVVTSFSTFDEDISVINAASQESGPLARGSIALALIQNDDDEEDVFTAQTITASPFNPPLQLGGIRIKVAGADARILAIAPETVKFILPAGIEANTNVLIQLTNGRKTFYTRTQVWDAAPGLYTVTDDGDGKVAAQCGLYLANGTLALTAPPCAISAENERRVVILKGTGWRFASGVKVTFNSIELTPTYAGAEPGIPGVNRIEIALPLSLAEDIGGLEKDILITASVDGTTTASQNGATLAFQETVSDEARARQAERTTTTRRNNSSTRRQSATRGQSR